MGCANSIPSYAVPDPAEIFRGAPPREEGFVDYALVLDKSLRAFNPNPRVGVFRCDNNPAAEPVPEFVLDTSTLGTCYLDYPDPTKHKAQGHLVVIKPGIGMQVGDKKSQKYSVLTKVPGGADRKVSIADKTKKNSRSIILDGGWSAEHYDDKRMLHLRRGGRTVASLHEAERSAALGLRLRGSLVEDERAQTIAIAAVLIPGLLFHEIATGTVVGHRGRERDEDGSEGGDHHGFFGGEDNCGGGGDSGGGDCGGE